MNPPQMLAIITVLLALPTHTAATVVPNPAELAESRQWVAAHFTSDAQTVPEPCFSFVYDGRPSSELLKAWDLKRTSRSIDEYRTEHSLVWSDPKPGSGWSIASTACW